MNAPHSEPKQQIGSKSVKLWIWLGGLFVASFCIILSISLLANVNGPYNLDRVTFALLLSFILALVALAGLWMIRWLCHWRNLRWALFIFACMLTLIALGYAEENWRGKRAWQKHRQQWEAKGEKFDFASFVPPPVPEEKNFAFASIFMPALEVTQGLTGVVWKDTNALARLQQISAELTPPRETNGRLALGSLEKGTFADLSACADFYRDNTNYPQAAPSATPSEVILAALNKFEPEIKQLREAAAERPYARFPVQYDYEPPWGILLPHLARVKGLNTLVHVRAIAELEAGRPAEAFDDLKLGFRLSDSIHDEPILIDHLVRLAMLGSNLQVVREGLIRKAWAESQLEQIESYLGSLDLLKEYKLAIHGERAFSVAGLDYLRRLSGRVNPMDFLSDDNRSPAMANGFAIMPRGWYYQNMVTLSSMHEQFSLPAVDEHAHRVDPELSEKAVAEIAKLPMRPYTIFAKLLLPALEKTVQKAARMQTFVDMGRIACAIERYRLVNGHYPERLDLLVPGLIGGLPSDLITGKPLHYQLEPAEGYVLYSVGWNRTDDGGRVGFTKQNKEVDVTKGDWVWQMDKS